MKIIKFNINRLKTEKVEKSSFPKKLAENADLYKPIMCINPVVLTLQKTLLMIYCAWIEEKVVHNS